MALPGGVKEVMTKIERYEEVEVRMLHKWEAACYWCGKIFTKVRQGVGACGYREHINIEHEPKIFCSKECKLQWIDCKQTFGELIP